MASIIYIMQFTYSVFKNRLEMLDKVHKASTQSPDIVEVGLTNLWNRTDKQ